MKKILFLFFISLQCFSQDKLVVYNFKILEDENILKNEIIGKQFAEDIKAANLIKLNLEFNDTIARFKTQKIMAGDDYDVEGAIIHCGCSEDKYIYNNKVYRNNSESTFKKQEYLIVDPIESKWQLINESKLIDGYECYKATTEYIVKNSLKTFYHPVVAWYCPQLPYSFGPSGYGGLPGLILELQVWNNVFGVEKIVLDHKLEEPIELPSKGEIITDDNYNKKIAESFEDFLED